MRTNSAYIGLAFSALASASALLRQPFSAHRADNSTPACLPQDDLDPEHRAAGVAARNEGFVYGPSLIGEASPFPNGTLGNARHEADMEIWKVDREEIDARIAKDVKAIEAAIAAVSPPTC